MDLPSTRSDSSGVTMRGLTQVDFRRSVSRETASRLRLKASQRASSTRPMARPASVRRMSALSSRSCSRNSARLVNMRDRKSTRLNSSHLVISYAVFCLKKKKNFHSLYQSPPKSTRSRAKRTQGHAFAHRIYYDFKHGQRRHAYSDTWIGCLSEQCHHC